MLHKIIAEVLSAWQVILVGLIIMIILPVVFYFASFDKNPVKIKRIPVKKQPLKAVNKLEDEYEEEDDERA